jgi:hypothetical protein
MRGAWLGEVHPWLQAKPLDAAIGQVPAPYCPSGHRAMVNNFEKKKKQKKTKKKQLLPSFLTIDQCKKGIKAQDPHRTLYSHHWCKSPKPITLIVKLKR